MGRFIVTKDGHNISDYVTIEEAKRHCSEIDSKLCIDKDDKYNHCTNCEHFGWWDGDYCCLHDMKILCESEDGKFHTKY